MHQIQVSVEGMCRSESINYISIIFHGVATKWPNGDLTGLAAHKNDQSNSV